MKSLLRNQIPKRTFSQSKWHSTTVCCVRKENKVSMVADGQVTMGHVVSKGNARKLRILGRRDQKVVTGFAGSVTDALTLNEMLEGYLEEHPGQLMRASVEMAKDWRKDKFLRKLEAMMIVADEKVTLLISGDGNVLEPEIGVCAIGSGGEFARAAAKGIMSVENDLTSTEIAHRALTIAADACIYSNHNFTKAEIDYEDAKKIKVKYDENSGPEFADEDEM
jgi:ATP-dependent HslUV protease subunit HslV